ncbi:malate dehydrogenase (oxaloacetate-decarboxylating)(NADP+) [Rhodobium orientis]|uniref:NADP-dependent malic enzyme n=1 Tax=Rhodobium orientis TaxID=34017 RepID=A0A327JGA3_9HYPH|nr:NADP-dependent malic enzyme [Rhodobium orientis]MBB4305509.1 malate dehydrogenase (oxaloacetate-decarboxylating)(NADP+) [Rhodobium orientis]MBK5949852.1 NADP-dependent malic enzyme [Rhodobium orientis]RAI24726.1 NADP-dependent malic enzyme [Rhodobium orientis]
MTRDAGEDRDKANDFDESALFYHEYPRPGKLEIAATKPLGNQRDLALAYSPGVAAPCRAIAANAGIASKYTARGNLVAVITNGTAVLGLGSIGPLAAKPVMEGKAVLFKKFAGIDVFDIEVDEKDPDRFCDTVASLEPTFGGINLEDIKAPECFIIERALRERMNVPVFHDDQHGTAIIVTAAVLNALELSGKAASEVKIVASGAGAAALACLNLLVALGIDRKNIWVTDIKGLVYKGRTEEMDEWKAAFAQDSDKRSLAEVIEGADIFLGLSAGGVLKPEMVAKMAPTPLIMALANPTPEIMPDAALAVREDALICTGRSDFPNQVNNVLCFPYIFRGALDVGATAINEEMKLAAVRAIADLAKEEPSDVAARAYGGVSNTFGPAYLIPSPFDQRLILRIAPAVARAAMETGVAARPIEDFAEYYERLVRFVFRSGLVMKPVIAAARENRKRVIYSDGEDERVLRAAQVVIEDGLADPILIGRPRVIDTRARRFGLKIVPSRDLAIINPEDDPRYRDYVDLYFSCVGRRGITPEACRTMVRTNSTVIGALAVRRGDADALICGLDGRFARHMRDVRHVVGVASGVRDFSALSLLLTPRGPYFLTDTYVTEDPGPEEIAEMTLLASSHIRRFGIAPKAALLSHSNFGTHASRSALKMREAVELLWEMVPDLEVDGEMHGDSALSDIFRERVMPDSRLTSEANLLVFPNLDAANIAMSLIKVMTDALHVGPILLGAAHPAHILTPSVTSRGVVNMSALAVVEAQSIEQIGATA